MKRTVCVVTGSRAEYGLLRPIMQEVRRRMRLQTIVTGMHLVGRLGHTVDEIRRDGFRIDARVPMIGSGDDAPAMARSIGRGVIGITDALQRLRPDVVLVLGDRFEAFAAAIAAAYSGRVLAHVHGGDSPHGGLDEYGRHAITKLAHLHFAATARSAARIRRLGERPRNVYRVGAPGLDAIRQARLPRQSALAAEHGWKPKGYVLFVMHPVSTTPDAAAREMTEALEGALSAGLPVIALYPNADAGGRRMLSALRRFRRRVVAVPSLSHAEFLALLRDAAALVGNSSSGIIEAPTFHVPVVNVGPRQAGRERASNVVDARPARSDVARALRFALEDRRFRARLPRLRSPYGDGRAARRIVDVLARVDLGPDLRRKRLTY